MFYPPNGSIIRAKAQISPREMVGQSIDALVRLAESLADQARAEAYNTAKLFGVTNMEVREMWGPAFGPMELPARGYKIPETIEQALYDSSGFDVPCLFQIVIRDKDYWDNPNKLQK